MVIVIVLTTYPVHQVSVCLPQAELRGSSTLTKHLHDLNLKVGK